MVFAQLCHTGVEQMGIIGPYAGSKPRQVLITYQQWLEMSMRQADESEE